MKIRPIFTTTWKLIWKSRQVWGFSLIYVLGTVLMDTLHNASRQGTLALQCLALLSLIIPVVGELGMAISQYHLAEGEQLPLADVSRRIKTFLPRWVFIYAIFAMIEYLPYKWLRDAGHYPVLPLSLKAASTLLLVNIGAAALMYLMFYILFCSIEGDLVLLPGGLLKGAKIWARHFFFLTQVFVLVGVIELSARLLIVLAPLFLLPKGLAPAIDLHAATSSMVRFLSYSWLFLDFPFVIALILSTYRSGRVEAASTESRPAQEPTSPGTP